MIIVTLAGVTVQKKNSTGNDFLEHPAGRKKDDRSNPMRKQRELYQRSYDIQ
jgi:hypothetical protein